MTTTHYYVFSSDAVPTSLSDYWNRYNAESTLTVGQDASVYERWLFSLYERPYTVEATAKDALVRL